MYQANGLITVQLAPDQVLAALSLDFEDGLRAREIEQVWPGSRRTCEAHHPEVVALFVKPQSERLYRELVRRRLVSR